MKHKRSNQQWLDELLGQLGSMAQQQAHQELADYLYRVAYNYLLHNANDLSKQMSWATDELALLAQDCVQDVVEKLVANEFALLRSYKGSGHFTSWAAAVTRNYIVDCLRRPPFMRRHVSEDTLLTLASTGQALEDAVARNEVLEALEACLAQLSELRRLAFFRCIGQDEKAQLVAELLQKTESAVFQLVMRAKREMRDCLSGKGVEKEVLSLF